MVVGPSLPQWGQRGLCRPIAIARSFFRYSTWSENLNPPTPPFSKGGTHRNSFSSPPLKKGDLGGFENHQWEGIFSKRSNLPRSLWEIPLILLQYPDGFYHFGYFFQNRAQACGYLGPGDDRRRLPDGLSPSGINVAGEVQAFAGHEQPVPQGGHHGGVVGAERRRRQEEVKPGALGVLL